MLFCDLPIAEAPLPTIIDILCPGFDEEGQFIPLERRQAAVTMFRGGLYVLHFTTVGIGGIMWCLQSVVTFCKVPT